MMLGSNCCRADHHASLGESCSRCVQIIEGGVRGSVLDLWWYTTGCKGLPRDTKSVRS
jgi:hypothetical protein